MQLPTEILQQVFLSFIASSSNTFPSYNGNNPCVRSPALVLSHVCSRWRQIATSYPPLWTIITHSDFYNYHWIDIVLQRSGSCILEVDLHLATQFADEELELLAFIQHTRKVKVLSLSVTNYELVQKLQSSYRGWASGLEKLQICIGDSGTARQQDIPTPDDSVQFGDYIASVNAQHLPNLPFFGKPYKLNLEEDSPHLRHLSLINCFVSRLSLYPNLERLEISHIPIECHHSVQGWSFVVRAMPHLKYLEIDGAMVWDPVFDPNFNEDPRLAKLPLLSQLIELRINRCTPACALFLSNFSAQPRSLQFTCTDVRYDSDSDDDGDEEFQLFCTVMRMWLISSWDATVPNRHLFISIQPDGIIVHNRSTRHKCSSSDDTTPTVLQLAMYWNQASVPVVGQRRMNMLSSLLNLLLHPLESQPNFDIVIHPSSAAGGPLTIGCEELELSVGLFDYDNRKLHHVVTQALYHFRDVKKLTCMGGAGALLASMSHSALNSDLLPMLECIRFDHVHFNGGIEGWLTDHVQLRAKQSQPLRGVELEECRSVDRDVVKRLEDAGTRVTLGKGTVFVDSDDSLLKNRAPDATRTRWTKDQVQSLMKKWTDEAR